MANNRIQVKRSSTTGRTPNTTSAGNTQYIAAGELALNMTDQTFFTSDGTNLIYVGANVVNKNVSNTLTVKAISANGSNGTSGYVLATNSTGTYWAPPSAVVGAINYAQNAAPQTYANSVVTPTILAQIAITTSGNPVQIIASGDANPLSAGGWGVLQLYRGTTAIGGTVNFESSAANENVPYSLQFIDAPAAGSYTYSLKVNSTTNNTQFGETSGPVISVVELQNVVGTMNTAAQYNFTNVETFSNTVIITNDKRAVFAPLAGGTNVYFTQQADDNFVFYSTNSTNGSRAVWSIFANNNTSNLTFSTQTQFNSNINFTSAAVYANATPGTAGQVLTTNGSSTYWSTAGVNVAAQYAWTNTQSFAANISFSNNIGLASAGGIYFNLVSDANWRMGRNTGGVGTKLFYTGNTLDIVAANSSLEGIAFGYTGNTYLETGYNGTYTRNPFYISTINSTSNGVVLNATSLNVGNSSVNSTMNATTFTGTANNSSYLGGTAASGYQTTAGLSANVATLSANVATYLSGLSTIGGNIDTQWTASIFGYTPTTTGTKPTVGYGTVLNMVHAGTTHDNAGNWLASLAFGTENTGAYFRTKTNGAAFSAWNTLLHNNNYNTYAPTLTGTGASGTWGISVTGTANIAAPAILGGTTANGASLTYANVSGQVNTATLYAATSANIASAVQANATGVYTTGTMNATSHTVGAAFTANSTVVNAVSYYSGTLLVANNTVVNATHLGGTAASGYQTTAGLSANVATLTSNNSTYLGGYTWAAPAALGSGTANSGVFTTLTTSSTSLLGGYAQIPSYSSMLGVKFPGGGTQYGLALQPAADSTNMVTFFNAANLAVGTITQTATTLNYNGTAAVLAYANVSGQVNTATFFATTSANVGANVQLTTSQLFVGNSTVNSTYTSALVQVSNSTSTANLTALDLKIGATSANTTTIKVGNTTLSTTNAIFGGTIATNGSIGTAGQVLTSGAGTNAYWSTITGSTTYMKGGSATQGSLATEGQNIFRVNANTINYNTTFVAGENGQATGPVAVATGISLIIQTGARVSIV